MLMSQRSSGGCDEIVQGSSDIHDETDTSSSESKSSDPKRPRLSEESKRYRPNDNVEDTTQIQVTRRERATLLKEFQRNQRLSRKHYKSTIRALWDTELADDKENELFASGEEIDSEFEAEAYEDYLFIKMMRYDGDTAFQLVEFRTTLRIIPESLGVPNHALIRDRTMALWEGLRRVYFGTTGRRFSGTRPNEGLPGVHPDIQCKDGGRCFSDCSGSAISTWREGYGSSVR
jgi:hypothetical protein